MSKFLVIALLLGILLFFIVRRVMNISSISSRQLDRNGFFPIEAASNDINKTIKTTLSSVAIGFLLLLAVVFFGMKIKILFILLPISFYLMGQIFLLANHINSTKNQRIWFNPKTNDLYIEDKKRGSTTINLYRDVRDVIEIKSIQKNRGILFGYFKLVADAGDVHIPFLYRENRQNRFFFEPLQHDFTVRSTAVFFPLT